MTPRQSIAPQNAVPARNSEPSFTDYYHRDFRSDLVAVMSFPPPIDHPDDTAEGVLRPSSLTAQNPVIRRWALEHRSLFGVALFLTVLVDQVCYTHFASAYNEFRALTRYPKLKGDCPSTCGYHVHPRAIFHVLGRSPFALYPTTPPIELHASIPAMRREVEAFVTAYLPPVDPAEFWQRCEAEIPAART